MENSTSKTENYNLWEGFIYLSFWIFANLFVLPNMPKSLTLNNFYPISLLIYGALGVFSGILFFKLVKDKPDWIKIGVTSIMYLLIFIRLITHWEIFTRPGN